MLPKLIVITDWSRPRLLAELARALEAGPGVALQHRHPGASGRQFYEEAVQLAALCELAGAPLFINGRLDVALAVGAHLHLPSSGPHVTDVRALLPSKLISAAVHSVEAAQGVGAVDFALVSPVFSPASKPDDTRPPLGAHGFQSIAQQLACPAFALGGISPTQCIGAAGYAVISGVLAQPDPTAAARALVARAENSTAS